MSDDDPVLTAMLRTNVQLMDAKEQVASLTAERDRLAAELRREEQDHSLTIDARDQAETAFGELAEMFDIDKEFSNLRGYAEISADCELIYRQDKTERDQLRAALEAVEWAALVPHPSGHSTTSGCWKCRQTKAEGHAPDCIVGKALGKVR